MRLLPLLEVKLTVPVGTPAPGAIGATLALTVTGSPYVEGSGVVVTVVVVAAWLTVCVALLREGSKVASPW